MTRQLWSTVVLLLTVASAVTAQEQSSPRFSGRPLAEALQTLQSQGLRLVFSRELVRRDMRVKEEPKSQAARQVLDELLKPHQLMAQDGPGAVISIVAVSRRRDPRSSDSAASAPGSIFGRVVDAQTGGVLAGVLVQLDEVTASTDDKGSFFLANVPSGRQSLYVSTIGYALARPRVDVQSSRITELTVVLAAGAGTYTEHLTVRPDSTLPSAALPPSYQSIGPGDLQDLRGVLADDPIRAIHALPGAAATDDFTSDFSLRGSAFTRVGVSLDGVATPWLLHEVKGAEDGGSIALVNGDVLDRVAVTSGVFSQRLGDRTGGWVEFELREGSRAARQVRGAVSMTNASVIVEGPLGKSRRGSWIASARQSYLDLVIRRVGTDTRPAFGFTDAHAKAVYDLGSRHQVQMTVLGGRSTLVQDDMEISVNAVRDGNSRTGFATTAIRSAWSRVVLTNRAIALGETFSNVGRVGQPLGRGTSQDFGLRSDISIAARPSLGLDAGAELRYQRGSWEEREYQTTDGLSLPPGPVINAGAETTRLGSAYIEGVWRSDRFRIAPGIRWTHSTIAARAEVSPWLLTSWQLSDAWRVKAGAGVHHQFPDLRQTAFYGATDRALSAEHARHVELALEQSLPWPGRWQVAVFHRDEDNMLRLEDSEIRLVDGRPSLPSVPAHLENALSASTTGIETLIQSSNSHGLAGWVSYSTARTRVIDTLTGEAFDGDYDQRHTFNAYGRYRLSARTTISSKLRVASNVPIAGYFERRGEELFLSDRRNQSRLPVYARLDARFNHVFNFTKRRLTLFVEVVNVLNRTNFGPDDGSIAFQTGRALGYSRSLLPVLPSAGLIVEF